MGEIKYKRVPTPKAAKGKAIFKYLPGIISTHIADNRINEIKVNQAI